MAKKKQPTVNTNLFAKTGTLEQANQDPEALKAEKEKQRRPVGVYLRVDTRAKVDKIAEAEGLSRHALLAFAVAEFVRQYEAGKVKIKKTTKTTLDLDT